MDSGTVDRRRHRRTDLAVPVLVRGLEEGTKGAFQEGLTKNLSLAGVYLTAPRWRPITMDEVVTLSISIPREMRREFPFSRLAGHGRVVRVEEQAQAGEAGQKRLTLAIEFAEDLTVLTAAPERM